MPPERHNHWHPWRTTTSALVIGISCSGCLGGPSDGQAHPSSPQNQPGQPLEPDEYMLQRSYDPESDGYNYQSEYFTPDDVQTLVDASLLIGFDTPVGRWTCSGWGAIAPKRIGTKVIATAYHCIPPNARGVLVAVKDDWREYFMQQVDVSESNDFGRITIPIGMDPIGTDLPIIEHYVPAIGTRVMGVGYPAVLQNKNGRLLNPHIVEGTITNVFPNGS